MNALPADHSRRTRLNGDVDDVRSRSNDRAAEPGHAIADGIARDQPGSSGLTRRSNLATVHVAMYDAVAAIADSFERCAKAAGPRATDASVDAAATLATLKPVAMLRATVQCCA